MRSAEVEWTGIGREVRGAGKWLVALCISGKDRGRGCGRVYEEGQVRGRVVGRVEK